LVYCHSITGKKNKKNTQKIYEKINALVNTTEIELPPVIALNNPESYDIWTLWRATGGRFLPSQLMEEPESMLSDIIMLDGIYQTIKDKADGRQND
jgi:hypothetical protein